MYLQNSDNTAEQTLTLHKKKKKEPRDSTNIYERLIGVLFLSIIVALNAATSRWPLAVADDFQQRDYFVYQKCGSESASFIGGPASRNRVEYVRCRTSARREFKRQQQTKIENINPSNP